MASRPSRLPPPFRVYMQWHQETTSIFNAYNVKIKIKDYFDLPDPGTVEDLADEITDVWEAAYEKRYKDDAQMQVNSITSSRRPAKDLPWTDLLTQHLRSGDTIIVRAMFMTAAMAKSSDDRQKNREEDMAVFRKTLRFDLNDRVICNCGPRWLSGHVVGTAVPEDGDLLPYLVKTDPLPGLESRPISVPEDSDDVCVQEVCFDPNSNDLHFLQASAPLLPSKKPVLRFAQGDKVMCRIRSGADGLEQWVPGCVAMIWPKLPGPRHWEIGGMSGEYPESVPYRVDLDGGKSVMCQADNHTLIRRVGMEPLTRVKGISKRLEVRPLDGGGKERVDHATERRKRLVESDSDDDSAS